MAPKRKIAVAIVKSSTGTNQRIELLTVADLIHLFALSMGYRPDIAFAFGVISRSSPDVQSGDCDVTVEAAQKAIIIASLINACRENHTMPNDPSQVEAVLTTTAHIHRIEQAYTELCSKSSEIQDTLAQQYEEWSVGQEKKEQKISKPSFVRRFIEAVRGHRSK